MKHTQVWMAWSPPSADKKKWTIWEEPSPMMEWIPVATIHGKGEVAEANATLISSAPEMLVRLKELQFNLLAEDSDGNSIAKNLGSQQMERLAKTIARAEGK